MHVFRVRNCSRLVPACLVPLNVEILKETTGYGLKLSNCAVTDKNLDMSQIVGF